MNIGSKTENRIDTDSKYKAVFFDAGNTLLRPYPSVEQVCSEVFAEHGFEIDGASLRDAVAFGDKYYEQSYWKDDRFWLSDREAEAMWIELYALVAELVGVNGIRRQLAKRIYDEFGLSHRWELFPDVEPVLQELRQRDFVIGVISNWDGRLPDILSGMGMGAYFDFVISSANVGLLKPQPEIFGLALERSGVEAHQAIHVGDHYYADVLGARLSDITPVLVDRSHAPQKADCEVVTNFSQILQLL